MIGESQVTRNNCDKFIKKLLENNKNPKVLIIGGAEKGSGTEKLWLNQKIEIHSTDIYITDNVDFICDAHYLPLSDNYYDGVFIQAVLEHVVQPDKVVKEIKKVEVVTKIKEIKKIKQEEKKSSLPKKQIKKTSSKADQATAMSKYLSGVRTKIQQELIFPSIAKRRRMSGVVTVSFVLLKDGSVTQIQVIESSSSIFEKSAIKTITNIKFDKIPNAINKETVNITIPISFDTK